MKQNIFVKRLTSLQQRNRKNSNAINNDLYKLLWKQEALMAGYDRIKKQMKTTTAPIDIGSFYDFSQAKMSRLSNVLQNESWKPRAAKQFYNGKPSDGKVQKSFVPSWAKGGKSGLRKGVLQIPAQIQGLEELIVQSTMLLILEAIYESVWSKTSFGFIPGKGCHDALKTIDQNYNAMQYTIEGNIQGMYDKVNHHTLVNLMKKKIQDGRFIRLTYKMLRAGYMEGSTTVIKPVIGTPQGSIVSPILANIYLHEFDTFMTKRSKDVQKYKDKVEITLPQNLFNNTSQTVAKKMLDQNLSRQQKHQYTKKNKSLKFQDVKGTSLTNRNTVINYIRYADDFIIGVTGGLQYTSNLKSDIQSVLETLGLTLNQNETKITNLVKDNAYFLGHHIRINTCVQQAYDKKKGLFLKQITARRININAPNNLIVQRLAVKGFCDYKGFPHHKKRWTTQEDSVIIQNFNAIIRGLFGFYSGVHNPAYLGRIWYILKFSCAKTLAARHNSSLKKIFTKHGPKLKVHYGQTGQKSIELYQPSLKVKNRKWQVGRQMDDPYVTMDTQTAKLDLLDNCSIYDTPTVKTL